MVGELMHKLQLIMEGTTIKFQGRPLLLRGVNLGGWLMMEGYLLHSPNIAERVFKQAFARSLGAKSLADFERYFRDNYIDVDDWRKIAAQGFNCVRIPFHYRLLERRPYRFDAQGIAYLDQAMQWAKKYRIWVILDLHAACGAQSGDWHADSLGHAFFWEKPIYQRRTIALWEFLADRYRGVPYLAGFELLNEPAPAHVSQLIGFYRELIQRIRAVDPQRIIFLEGYDWARRYEELEALADLPWVLSVHFYEPVAFTFHLQPLSHYGRKTEEGRTKLAMEGWLQSVSAFARRTQRPVIVSEFGLNYRGGHFGETAWLRDFLSCSRQERFHWTYWTWKAVKVDTFPDGIWSYLQNPLWVNRQGPRRGWEQYAEIWRQQHQVMARSWRTDQFVRNDPIANLLKEACTSKL
jgi:hypothetical protein